MKYINSICFVILACIVLFIVISIPLFVIKKKCKNRKLAYTIYTLILVFMLRFGVTLLCKVETGEGLSTDKLNSFEKMTDSLIHTLQTFSMDEDYTQYTVLGKSLLIDIGLSRWAYVYGFAVSVLDVLAPILGGALLLEILTGVFPIISIRIRPFRQKIVFSELNMEAICLAEDISKNYKKIIKTHKFEFRPLIIFTDAYVDDESEINSELFNRAKKIGAICVKTDLTNLSFSHSKSIMYLLMDHNVSDSITAFSSLVNQSEKWPKTQKAIKKFSLVSTVPFDFKLNENNLKSNIKFSASGIDMNGIEIKDDDFITYISDFTIKNDGNDKKTICVNFDFSKRPLDNSQKISISINYTEIDEDESKQELVEEKVILSRIYEPVTRIYIFVHNPQEAEMVRSINEKSENASNIVLRTIQDYMNASINLMHKAPLFLPLLESECTVDDCVDLYITIFGSGNIAEEVFKTVFWCGQMLRVKLHINVLSNNVNGLKRKIQETCPELLKCNERNSPILKVFPKNSNGGYNPPYVEELNFTTIWDSATN